MHDAPISVDAILQPIPQNLTVGCAVSVCVSELVLICRRAFHRLVSVRGSLEERPEISSPSKEEQAAAALAGWEAKIAAMAVSLATDNILTFATTFDSEQADHPSPRALISRAHSSACGHA
eukprot:6656575-Prymnesium_polylepis.1